MKHSETIANLAASLVAAQADLRAVGKDAVNPHFKNRYASLDAIVETTRPVLAKHGLAVVQGASPIIDEHTLALSVETMLVHRSGEWLSNVAVVPVSKMDAQGAGGALTYGRRYGLSALLSLATDEDDDGNTASRPTQRAAASVSEPNAARHEAPAPQPARENAAPVAGPVDDEPACPKCSGKMWDNRLTKRNPRAPDWKCRDKACDGAIWSPRAGTAASAPAKPISHCDAWQAAVASADEDDRSLPF